MASATSISSQTASFSPQSSFDDAVRAASLGYSDPSILAKHRPYPSMDGLPDYIAPMLATFALVSQRGSPIRVCDFGGNSGYFYSYVQTFFGPAKMNWRVVETPEQVDYCDGTNVPGLEFSTSIGCEPYDLAIFSGVIQYLSDWTAPFRELNAEFIFIARTPIDEVERPYLHKFSRAGGTFRLAGRVIKQPDLFALLSETHEMIASWDLRIHLSEMGEFKSPAMLWRRRTTAAPPR